MIYKVTRSIKNQGAQWYHITRHATYGSLPKKVFSINFFQVIDIVDLTPILRENILHANFCFLRK